MATRSQKILYFGDQTDDWVDGIDQLYRQAATTPWLRTLLEDLLQILKEESKGMDRVLQNSVGDYSSFLDLADRYRYSPDGVGLANAMLLHVLRAAMLLQWVKREPELVNGHGQPPEMLGISGGLTNLAALAISTDFDSLYTAVLEGARIFVRLCIFTSIRSRAMEDHPGAWGWAVIGADPDELRTALEEFQQNMGIPPLKRAKVGVTGDRWSTVIGAPPILDLVLHQCPALKDRPKNPLNIHALQHAVTVVAADLDYIVGNSRILQTAILPDFRIWGMDDPAATYEHWGALLRAIISQILSQPLDITKVIAQLNASIGSCHLDVKVIGPSSHTPYISRELKAGGNTASFAQDKDLEQTSLLGTDRIAIVGMAGRGPGSDNVDELWDVIMSQQDRCEEIPKDRFNLEDYFCSEHKNGECTTTTRFGCFMNKPGNFDSRFFHVSPREALLMDPGHRQFLMSTYEALEVAGYSDGKTRATDPHKIAAFYGQSNDDWHMVSHYTLGCDAYTLQGAQRAFGAGRAAFHFNWEGPTYSLDSACASTTSAIHLACLSLLKKDIDMAVVGAANIVGYPHSWTSLSKSGVLSDTGNCKTYRDDADGYCRADFVGTVVLKRLKDAIDSNDNVLAVVAGSGRNHSGNSTSITTSDAGAQERLFRKIMHSAGVAPNDISYVEMHGTGTQIGDPAEMSAVASIFKHRNDSNPLTVGGVKANIGHSEAAAGMASLLKCIMMFQNSTMPPQCGMPHSLNPRYPDLSRLNIEIPAEPKDFKSSGKTPRRILLNNFDAAGGNACMILEDYTNTAGGKAEDPRSSHVIVTSAKTKSSYHANKRKLLEWLRENPDAKLQDIAYTTTARRMHHSIRFACTASTTQELMTKLDADTVEASQARGSPIVFLFTGQGSHYAGMGRDLYETCPSFREAIDLCVTICDQHGFSSFLDIITDENVDLSSKDTMQIQLAVVSLEVALAAFWIRSCGVEPSVVMGHSLGEFVALHVAGVLSLADLLYVVGKRASLLQERCEAGTCAMLAVPKPTDAIQELLDTTPQSSCGIACKNSPNATVVSGSNEDIAELKMALDSSSKLLSVPYGFHSFQMDPILDDYIQIAGGLTYSSPRIPIASTLHASIVDAPGICSAAYMGQQTRQAVDFVGALGAVTANFDDPVWIEIGPSQVCGSFVRSTLHSRPEKIMSTLEANTNPWVSISKCLSELYKDGIAIDWLALHAPFAKSLTLLSLPSYAWDLKDYWIEYTESKPENANLVPTHALEKEQISTCAQTLIKESSSPHLQLTLRASTSDPGFLALFEGHRIRNTSICPGSAFCEAGMAAAKYALQHHKIKIPTNPTFALRGVSLKRPFTKLLADSQGELLTTVSIDKSNSNRLEVSWTTPSLNFGGCVVTFGDAQSLQADWARISYFVKAKMNELIKDVKAGNGHRMLPGIFYALFSNTVDYDTAFKCIKEAFVNWDFDEAAAEVVLRRDPPGTRFVASPYWGESLVQLAGFLVNANPDRQKSNTTFMMDSFESFEQTAELEPEQTYFTYVRIAGRAEDTITCDVFVFDSTDLILQCSGLRFHEVTNASLDRILGNSTSASRGADAQTSKVVVVDPKPTPITVPARSEAGEAQNALEETAEREIVLDTGTFDIIIESISKETGTNVSDLVDETELAELGVDSIMGIEIAARANNQTDLEILPSFVLDYPTIGDLRNAFKGGASNSTTPPSPSLTSTSGSSTIGSSVEPADDRALTKQEQDLEAENVDVPLTQDEEDLPAPSTKVTLMQGRPSSREPPFYLIADGTGSIATYIHLAPFKSKRPIYGINSPYSNCPSRFGAQGGIPAAAKYIVSALLEAQPEGPFSIGGFSGGAMLSYEVCHQLAAAGRIVDSLLLIDMCCPRPAGAEHKADIGWKIYESIATHSGGLWRTSDLVQQHLRAIFASVAEYHPRPMTEQERPKRTAIIWAEKGLIDRCSSDDQLMDLLSTRDIPIERFDGFMEDARMGSIAWGLPHKTAADLGPNGWEKYVGEMLCLSINADHLEMPMPGHVHLLHKAIEEAFEYLNSSES